MGRGVRNSLSYPFQLIKWSSGTWHMAIEGRLSMCVRKCSADSRIRWNFHAALCLVNPLAFLPHATPGPESPTAWPRAGTYQCFLKVPPIINVIHLVGPRQVQVVVVVHAGDAEAVFLLCRGALDELEREEAGYVRCGPQT